MISDAQLLKQWENDNLGLAAFLGEMLSNIPNLTDTFCTGFGESLFERLRICSRIDHLYDEASHCHRDKKEFHKTVIFGYQDGVAFIEDRIGDYGHASLMMLRDLDPPNQVYAVRIYAEDGGECPPYLLSTWVDKLPTFDNIAGQRQHVVHNQLTGDSESDYEHICDHDEVFWNFVCDGGRLKNWEHSEGFLDLRMTRRIALLIKWTSNMLGFQDDRMT